MFDLTGRVALITGASGGIGSAIATALHDRGAWVVLTGTRQNALESLANNLGERCSVVATDLADRAEVETLIERAAATVGNPIDILINNAGITRDGLLMRMAHDDWAAVLDINLTAAMVLSRGVLRSMMKQRWGRIIQISSIVGYTGNAGQANYAAAKSGLAGFTKALAQEVASRGITANIIAPGFIRTPMTDALTQDQHANLLKSVPAGRLGEPQDIATAAAFLASTESAYITGATLHINGGMAML